MSTIASRQQQMSWKPCTFSSLFSRLTLCSAFFNFAVIFHYSQMFYLRVRFFGQIFCLNMVMQRCFVSEISPKQIKLQCTTQVIVKNEGGIQKQRVQRRNLKVYKVCSIRKRMFVKGSPPYVRIGLFWTILNADIIRKNATFTNVKNSNQPCWHTVQSKATSPVVCNFLTIPAKK